MTGVQADDVSPGPTGTVEPSLGPLVLPSARTIGIVTDDASAPATASSEPTAPPSLPPEPSNPSPSPSGQTPTPSPSATQWPLPSIIERAVVAPAPTFRAGAFRASAYTIARLAWSRLPYNGLGLLSTSLTGRHEDADGIPYKIVNGVNYYNPGTIAMQGCRYIDAYVRTGNPVYLDRVERRAARLRKLSFAARGARWLAYRFNYWGEGLSAPWVSALAQGGGLSFFVRLYRVTGDPADLTMARSLFLSFRTLGRASHPWAGYVDADGYLRLEEYPGPRPSHVFNGANFGFFGVYDYAMLTGDPVAIKIARAHLTAMRHYASRYRDPGWLSFYDLLHRTQSVHYHAVNRWQLQMLGWMGGGSWFTGMYQVFMSDYSGGKYP